MYFVTRGGVRTLQGIVDGARIQCDKVIQLRSIQRQVFTRAGPRARNFGQSTYSPRTSAGKRYLLRQLAELELQGKPFPARQSDRGRCELRRLNPVFSALTSCGPSGSEGNAERPRFVGLRNTRQSRFQALHRNDRAADCADRIDLQQSREIRRSPAAKAEAAHKANRHHAGPKRFTANLP